MLARLAVLVPAVSGSVLLGVAEFTTLLEIRVITVVKETTTAGAHHGYALLVIAVAALFMAWGAAAGGSGPAQAALLILAIAACAVVGVVDLPDINEEGLIGRDYEQAVAEPGLAFYLESLGAALLLLGGAAGVLLRPEAPKRSEQPARRREPVSEAEPKRGRPTNGSR